MNKISKEISNLRKQKKNLENKNFTANFKLRNSNKEITRLLKELELAKGKTVTSVKADGSSESKISRLRKELIIKRDDVESLEKDLSGIKKKYNILLSDKEKADATINNLLKEVEANGKAKEYNQYWEKKVRELKKDLSSKENKNKQLDTKLVDLDRIERSLEYEIKNLESENSKLQNSNRTLETRLERISSGLNEKNSEIEKMKDQLESLSENSDTERASLKAKLVMQKDQLERVTTLYESLKRQLQETSTLLLRREQDLENKNKEMIILQDEIAYLKTKLNSFRESLRQSQDSQRLVIERLEDLTEMNMSLQDRLSEAYNLDSKKQFDKKLLDPNGEEEGKKIEVFLEPMQ